MDEARIVAAARYAEEAHRGQQRKQTGIPYVTHLWSVAALVLEYGGDADDAVVALLHDVVEDAGGARRLAEVRRRFGDDVADRVAALSDSTADTTAGEEKAPWRQRKEAYLAQMADLDARTALVAGADKLHNLRSLDRDLRQHGAETWSRFNQPDPAEHLWYYRSVVAALADRLPLTLAEDLARAVDDLAARLPG